jgi:hypothetical protein
LSVLKRELPRRARDRAYIVSARVIGRFWGDAELILFQSQADDPLAALLASLNIDPSDLDLSSLGLGEIPGGAGGAAGAGGDFSGLLDGMMKQLMTKEILEEPLAELGEKVCFPFAVPQRAGS